jgi:hypothetical protein
MAWSLGGFTVDLGHESRNKPCSAREAAKKSPREREEWLTSL